MTALALLISTLIAHRGYHGLSNGGGALCAIPFAVGLEGMAVSMIVLVVGV